MATATVTQIGSDLWNAGVYAGLSTASELAAELDSSQSGKHSEIDARKVRDLLDQLNGFLARGLRAADKYVPDTVGTPKEKLLAARDSILSLYSICERLLSLSSDMGNVQNELELLRTQSEQLLDVADWLDALSTPEEINAKFEAASVEFAKGNVVPWAAIP
jgi:hypothetical protein